VDHFRIFGCIAYAHVLDEKRKKLDDKGDKCMFLWVSKDSKAYKLYNPITKKIMINQDVVFDEKKKWSWEADSSREYISTNFDEESQEQQPSNSITTNLPPPLASCSNAIQSSNSTREALDDSSYDLCPPTQ